MKDIFEQYQLEDWDSETTRIHDNVYKKDKHFEGFLKRQNLAEWWKSEFNRLKGCCAYCETPIHLIRELIAKDLIGKRKVRNGYRGPSLELEKKDPRLGYSPQNCTLICYYCNNDKSNVYKYEEYIKFHAPAKKQHFLFLWEKLKST